MKQLDIEAVSRCFFPPDHRVAADVGIVFGMNDPRRPARHAIELYRSGFVGRLLFTGGHNPRLGATEAECMAQLALNAGIPLHAILVEGRAANTDENAALSCRLLEGRALLNELDSVMLVTIHYHLRRACLAIHRWFPETVRLSWACYASHHYAAENWFATEQGRRDVRSEIEKIQRHYGLTVGELLRHAE